MKLKLYSLATISVILTAVILFFSHANDAISKPTLYEQATKLLFTKDYSKLDKIVSEISRTNHKENTTHLIFLAINLDDAISIKLFCSYNEGLNAKNITDSSPFEASITNNRVTALTASVENTGQRAINSNIWGNGSLTRFLALIQLVVANRK